MLFCFLFGLGLQYQPNTGNRLRTKIKFSTKFYSHEILNYKTKEKGFDKYSFDILGIFVVVVVAITKKKFNFGCLLFSARYRLAKQLISNDLNIAQNISFQI